MNGIHHCSKHKQSDVLPNQCLYFTQFTYKLPFMWVKIRVDSFGSVLSEWRGFGSFHCSSFSLTSKKLEVSVQPDVLSANVVSFFCSYLIGEEGYCLTSMQSALAYVESLNTGGAHLPPDKLI